MPQLLKALYNFFCTVQVALFKIPVVAQTAVHTSLHLIKVD